MTTPRKSFNYNTPYARPGQQQYPSQSEDYISFDMGGPTQMNARNPSSNEKTPARFNPKYYQQNYRNSNGKQQQRRNLFNNNYGQQQKQNQHNRQSFNNNQQQFQQQRFNHRNSRNERSNQKQNFQSSVRNNNSISSYLHPSMTEDPWFELMQRLQALENSKISIKETSPAKDTANSSSPPSDTNSNSDSDLPDEDDVDSVNSD
ncbi:uncharacterized protein ACRADG_003682 [Cochliomyia hominivorax]